MRRVLFFEVAVVEAFESSSVACFVFCHFVYGVVDCVEVCGFCVSCDSHFVFAGSGFGVHAFFEVCFGVPDDVSEEFGEFGAVFGFFEGVAFECFGDFGVSFAVGLAAHCDVHSDFGCFAEEVCVEVFDHFVACAFCFADFVFGDELECVGFNEFFEFFFRLFALRAEFGGFVSFVYVAAYGADEFFHCCFGFLVGLYLC